MPRINVSEDTFLGLRARAEALGISVDDLVNPTLDQLAGLASSAPEPQQPLTGDAWRTELEAWKRDALARAGRYPPGFVLDDRRDAIYSEREDAPL
jgi:hypothetical protein